MRRLALSEFYGAVYRPRRLPGGGYGTQKMYQIALSQFGDYLKREPLVTDLTEDNLGGFLAWLRDGGRATSTCNVTLARLMALARYAFRKRLLRDEPEIQKLREPKRVPRAFRTEQIGALLDAAGRLTGNLSEDLPLPRAAWWVALIHVCYWTGLRIKAALSVEQSNVDLKGGTLLVLAEEQKQNADQLFRLHSDCVDAISQMWLPKRQLLFPWPWVHNTLYRHFRKILKAADLPTGRRDLFQKIRRTTYSYSKLGGIDAGRQLGHSRDMSAHYEDPTITQERQACDVLPRPEPPKPTLRIVG